MIRIGIIGAGPNATGHASCFGKCPRTHVAAVADTDFPRAEALATQCGDAQPVRDYREFLDRVDAVVISWPNFLHCEQAVACAAAGKHLYCEKPMGLNFLDCIEHDAAPVADVHCGLKVTQVCAAVLESCERGEPVALPTVG